MPIFQDLLRNTIVALALVSEYTVIFDYYIWTPSGWSRTAPSTEAARSKLAQQRHAHVLKTALAYAVHEPVCYHFLASYSHKAMYWLLMSAYAHIFATTGGILILAAGMQKVIAAHRALCEPLMVDGDGLSTDSEAAVEPKDADDATVESIYVDDVILELKSRNDAATVEKTAGTAAPVAEPAPRPRIRLGPHCPHAPPFYYKLALLLPTATSAATNAGLQVYARYLHSEDSQAWLEHFAFGWTAIALLILFTFLMAKWMNLQIAQASNRRFRNLGADWVQEVVTRLAMLLSLLIVRTCLRALLEQPLLATVASGFVLVGDAGTSSRMAHEVDAERQRAKEAVPTPSSVAWEWSLFLAPFVSMGIALWPAARSGVRSLRRRFAARPAVR